jgi:hypothetical protein
MLTLQGLLQMNYKKLLSVFAAGMLSLSLLTACNNTSEITENTTAPAATTTAATTVSEIAAKDLRIKVDDKNFVVGDSTEPLWMNGVNTPWDKWNDFGGDFDEAFWEEHFKALNEIGCNSSRVWVNCNGQTVVRFKTTGEIKDINPKHWTDLDKLFEIAEKYEIYLMPTILSFDHFKDGNSGKDQWRALVQDDTLTQQYIDMYVLPFVERYKENPYCFAIDIMNEPDWVHENAESGKIDADSLTKFFAKVSAAIHENSDILVTVGIGCIKYNSEASGYTNWISDARMTEFGGENAVIDFWSTHYYYWQRPWMGYPFKSTPEEWGLTWDRPAVIGECNALGDEEMQLVDQYTAAKDLGYNGVYAWTSHLDDGNSDGLPSVTPALQAAA